MSEAVTGAGLYIDHKGHRTWLKWHRGRRTITDIPFTAARIAEGMRLGASVEIDLLRFAGEGFVVLHDEDLYPATTGRGSVAEASRDVLRSLFFRKSDGTASSDPVFLLDDLVDLIKQEGAHPDACLQLDMKSDSSEIREQDIAAFVRAVKPMASSMILSAGDAEAVTRLSDALPDLPIGYDPCHFGAIPRLMESRDFEGFVEGACLASPRAQMMYLEHQLVLFADAHGFDLTGAFHERGCRVDAYTINRAVPEVLPIVERLLELGVDQITTDDPIGLEALIKRSR